MHHGIPQEPVSEARHSNLRRDSGNVENDRFAAFQSKMTSRCSSKKRAFFTRIWDFHRGSASSTEWIEAALRDHASAHSRGSREAEPRADHMRWTRSSAR